MKATAPLPSFGSYQQAPDDLFEDQENARTGNRRTHILYVIAILAGAGVILNHRTPRTSISELSSEVSCDACVDLTDDECLGVLQSALTSLEDPEKLSLEKDLLSHKFSCGNSLSDESCLAYLDSKIDTLSNDEQLSLLKEECSSGNLNVQASVAPHSKKSHHKSSKKSHHKSTNHQAVSSGGTSVHDKPDEGDVHDEPNDGEYDKPRDNGDAMCETFGFREEPPDTVMDGGFIFNQSITGCSNCMTGTMKKELNILSFEGNKYTDVTVISEFITPKRASDKSSQPYIGLRMKEKNSAFSGGFCKGHTGLACGLDLSVTPNITGTDLQYKFKIKECSETGSLETVAESNAYEGMFALQVDVTYSLNFSAVGTDLACSLIHSDGNVVASYAYSDHTYDKQNGYVVMGDEGAYNHYFKSVKICADDSPTSQPTLKPTAPTPEPSATPSYEPTTEPSSAPTSEPSAKPSYEPTTEPSSAPTSEPSAKPSYEPTTEPSSAPTSEPSAKPSYEPSPKPSSAPTSEPSFTPSYEPSPKPSFYPTTSTPTKYKAVKHKPTRKPTHKPSYSHEPTISFPPSPEPTEEPTFEPSSKPSVQPSLEPTASPSFEPTTSTPTAYRPVMHKGQSKPTHKPSHKPTTLSPTAYRAVMHKGQPKPTKN